MLGRPVFLPSPILLHAEEWPWHEWLKGPGRCGDYSFLWQVAQRPVATAPFTGLKEVTV